MKALLVLFSLAWLALPAGAQPQPRAQEAEVCKGCHEDYVQSYLATKHGAHGNVRGATCVNCHGEGALEHARQGGGRGVAGIVGFNNKAIAPDRKSNACISCHGGNRHLAFWSAGAHRKNDVACSDCHSLHGNPGPGSTVALKKPNPTVSYLQTTNRQQEYETCTSCHKQIRSQLLKPSHHPIIEGKVACSDCHNPHGALSKAMIKAESIPQLCTSCHAEKRGPFVWGHAPVEENCLTCHNSHGSTHARLLVQKAPNLCQDCHDAAQHPGTLYDNSGSWVNSANPNTRLIARGCVNCHNTIHGSNAPARRGQRFTR